MVGIYGNGLRSNKNVDMKPSAHDTFLEQPSPGTSKDQKAKQFNQCMFNASL